MSTQFSVFGAQNLTATKMVIYGLDILSGWLAETDIRVRVLVCPIGFEFDNSTARCECSTDLQERGVQCNTSTLTLIVPSGLWVGPVEGSTFAVADCIQGLCEPGAASLSVRNGTIDFNVQCKEGLNRGGVLCGSCRNGYSNVFGGIHCQRCSNRYAAILILYMLLGALIIIFLIVFRINLSSGYVNGVLFWCNIVSLYEMVLAPSQSRSGAAFLANWLTLNWGIETCMFPRRDDCTGAELVAAELPALPLLPDDCDALPLQLQVLQESGQQDRVCYHRGLCNAHNRVLCQHPSVLLRAAEQDRNIHR